MSITGRSTMQFDGVTVRGILTLGEFAVTSDHLDEDGVLSILAEHEGVTMIVEDGVILSGIRVIGDDGETDVTTTCGGLTMFVAVDDPLPASCTFVHEDVAVAAELRFTCPTASGLPSVSVAIKRLQTSIRYSSALQRWVVPNWAL